MPLIFDDEVNPTDAEMRRWAYSGAPEPFEDFDIIVADPEHLTTLLDLVADRACPQRRYLLGSLYCLIGHSDLTDRRILTGIEAALTSGDPWLTHWASRARPLLDSPGARVKDDWCGWKGLRAQP